jgi:hypothetical protein
MGVIIKSGSTAFSGATVKGNFSYYVDPTIDLGPSDVTGFYSGIEPPSGGYTVYKTEGSVTGGIVIRTATDSSILNSVLIDFGAPYATLPDNLNWADSNNDILVLSGGGASYYSWVNYYIGFAPVVVCNQTGEQVTLYTAVPSLGIGVQLYTNTSLSTPYSGSSWFGVGGFATDAYNVNSSGIIQNSFPFPCGVTAIRVGQSNTSQNDACLYPLNQEIYTSASTLDNGVVIYQDKYCTIPYSGSSYVGDSTASSAYGFDVNPSTGVLSNKTYYGDYYGTDQSVCGGPADCQLVGFKFILGPSSISAGNHYYDNVSSFDYYVYGKQGDGFSQPVFELHAGYSGPSATCLCP